jgi:hypothetical protein
MSFGTGKRGSRVRVGRGLKQFIGLNFPFHSNSLIHCVTFYELS